MCSIKHYLAGFDIEHGAHDLDFAFFSHLAQHRTLFCHGLDVQMHVVGGDNIDKGIVGRTAVRSIDIGRGQHSRADLVQQLCQIAKLNIIASAFNAAVMGVAQDDDQLGTGDLRCVFQASQNIGIDHIARNPCGKQVTYVLVEDQRGR